MFDIFMKESVFVFIIYTKLKNNFIVHLKNVLKKIKEFKFILKK